MIKKFVFVIIFLLVLGLGYTAGSLQVMMSKDTTEFYNYYLQLGKIRNKQIAQTKYSLNYFKDSGGSYVLSPIGKGDILYVESSAVPLNQYLGKEIQVTGHWVLTTKQLKHADYSPDNFSSLLSAVAIESIQLVK